MHFESREFKDEIVRIDGNDYVKCRFERCGILYDGGIFPAMDEVHFENCRPIIPDGLLRRLAALCDDGRTPLNVLMDRSKEMASPPDFDDERARIVEWLINCIIFIFQPYGQSILDRVGMLAVQQQTLTQLPQRAVGAHTSESIEGLGALEPARTGRYIPDPIKRTVRQECHFGCVICGCPVFHYHHIIPYAQAQEHAVENLALLCEQHHSALHGKRLSNEIVIERRLNPYNQGRNFTTGYGLSSSRNLSISLGSNSFGLRVLSGNSASVISINGENFFLLHNDDGWLSFSFVLTDREGRAILVVQRGEIIVSTTAWDYEFEGNKFVVRSGPRNIELDVSLSDVEASIHSASFLYEGIDGVLIENGILFTQLGGVRSGFRGAGNVVQGALNGLCVFNAHTVPGATEPQGFVWYVS